MAIAFGPVPSRRLGRSLGLNHIPPKHCSYSCAYCQVGRTRRPQVHRQVFFDPAVLLAETAVRLDHLRRRGERVDYLTFVPDGEPTLDAALGRFIDELRPLGVPIAVITNASLLDREEVRYELGKADWVSLKVDAADEQTWRRLNRPHGALRLESLLDGMLRFARDFDGQLVTDTTLVKGLNDDPAAVVKTAAFVARLRPHTAFLGIPVRPPAEPHATAPGRPTIAQAQRIFAQRVPVMQMLTDCAEADFAFTGDAERDLLSTVAVHPMRHAEVKRFLSKARTEWSMVERLLASGRLREVDYRGERFFTLCFFDQPYQPAG